jgi:hypothetical protein
LDQLLHVPDQAGYVGCGLQIVRGNILRGRPKFLDSLNIWYIGDHVTDQLPVNDTLHGGRYSACADGWGEKFWRGPVVAYLKAGNDLDAKKMKNMTLTAYPDAIDYLGYYCETIGSMIDQPGSSAHRSKVIMGERSGKVKGVRLNCDGDAAGDPSRRFVSVDVPRNYPLFTLQGDDPLEIPQHFDEDWVVYRYNGYKDPSAPEAQNHFGKLLQLVISEEYLETTERSQIEIDTGMAEWGKVPDHRQADTTGRLLLVSQSKGDVDVRKAKAICEMIGHVIGTHVEDMHTEDREALLDLLTSEALERFM